MPQRSQCVTKIHESYKNNLHFCRLYAGAITQKKIMADTGIAQAVLSKYESNQRFMPIEHALILCEYLNIQIIRHNQKHDKRYHKTTLTLGDFYTRKN